MHGVELLFECPVFLCNDSISEKKTLEELLCNVYHVMWQMSVISIAKNIAFIPLLCTSVCYSSLIPLHIFHFVEMWMLCFTL